MSKIERLVFPNASGEKLVGILSNSDNKNLVIVSHELGSNKDMTRFEYIERLFNSLGFATFRFDYSGHGGSEGNMFEYTISKALGDLKASYDLLRHQFSSVSYIGSGFGGLVSAIHMSEVEDAKFGIYIATPFDYQKHLEISQPQVFSSFRETGFYEQTDTLGQKYKLGVDLYNDSQKYIASDYLKKIHYPLLVIYGEKDSEVGFYQATEASDNLSNYQIEIIKDMPHTVDFDEFPIVAKIVRNFLRENIE